MQFVPRFKWDGKKTRWVDKVLMEKVHMWEEEHHQAGEGEEHIKLGQHQCPVLFQNDLKKNLKNDLSRFCIEPSGQDSNGELG
jgi:hypothetical protein